MGRCKELVDSSYQPTYGRAGGPQPHPLRLVMHLPAGQPAGHLNLQGKRANHASPVPLHPPWATTRFGIEYVGISRRLASIFAKTSDAVIRVRTSGPPVRRRTP